jgi:hypothetical protein
MHWKAVIQAIRIFLRRRCVLKYSICMYYSQILRCVPPQFMFSKLVIAYRFCVVYVRKTNKMHTFLNNLSQLNYPRHISNKYFFIIRRFVQAAYSILSCILKSSLSRWIDIIHIEYSYDACRNTVSCLYRPPDDGQLLVRNMSRII